MCLRVSLDNINALCLSRRCQVKSKLRRFLLHLLDICGLNITSPAGLISSPNYPEYYPANEDCNITISTEEKPIKINFHAFDVGNEE